MATLPYPPQRNRRPDASTSEYHARRSTHNPIYHIHDLNPDANSSHNTTISTKVQKSFDHARDFEFKMYQVAPDVLQAAAVQSIAPDDENFSKEQVDAQSQLVESQALEDKPVKAPSPLNLQFSSCRMDSLRIDLNEMELRCMSYRSDNSSSYWGSGPEKDTGYSSSQRDSNGSSQGSCIDKLPDVHESAARRQAPELPSQSRRRSLIANWKSFFVELKRAARLCRRMQPSIFWMKAFGNAVAAPTNRPAARGGLNRLSSTVRSSVGNVVEGIKRTRRSTSGVGELRRNDSSAFGIEEAKEKWKAFASNLKTMENGKILQKNVEELGTSTNISSRSIAMASCPGSRRLSFYHKTAALPLNNKINKSINRSSGSISSNSSTMHGVHKDVQDAIAHCKESMAGKLAIPSEDHHP